MNKFLALGLIASLSFSTAFAQSSPQNQQSTAQNSVNVLAIGSGGYGDGGAAGGGGSHETIRYAGAPFNGSSAIPASNYISGTNPCLVGMGGSAVVGSIGASMNYGKSDAACTTREDARTMYQMYMVTVAVARLCQQQKIADAVFAGIGAACLGQQKNKRYRNPTTRMVVLLSADGDMTKARIGIYPIGYQIPAVNPANPSMTIPANAIAMLGAIPGQ